ncbi:MAG: DUF4080 domain-containing protein [Firmicutes bacterium]|nr:DUF4080 domain-containing protein [Bacillota bacterium]
MKILLTTLNSQYIHTALALYTLQAYCRRDFPAIEVLEFNINQDLNYILGAIYRRRPDVVGLSTNIWNITSTLELVDRIKKVLPRTVVILGGPEATADDETILRRAGAPDFIIRGEGEETLRELLTKLQRGEEDFSSVAGMSFREGTTIRRTPDRAPIDLAAIPFPYPDLAPFRDRILYYEASRGCPFRCAYCLSGWEKTPLRALALDRVQSDLFRLIRARVRTVKFIDRTFNLDRSRAVALLRFLLEHGGETEFHFELVGELLDEEMIALLKAAPAGRFRVEIGVQSTCPAALQAVGRKYDLARLKANCLALTTGGGPSGAVPTGTGASGDAPGAAPANSMMAGAPVRAGRPTVHLDLIAGLPYEDLATFARSFDWTFRLRPDELQLGFLKLLKGSPLRTEAETYGYTFTAAPPYELLGNKWLSYADLLLLKGVEEMVEKYFNSQHFRYTLAYLFRDDTLSPWVFFSELARFWQEKGPGGQAHKQVALYDGLWRFLTAGFSPGLAGGDPFPRGAPVARDNRIKPWPQEHLRALLTLDYYLSGTGGAAPEWLLPQAVERRETVKKLIKEGAWEGLPFPAGLSLGEVRRRMLVFDFPLDPEGGGEGLCPLLIYLPAQGRPRWFRLLSVPGREAEEPAPVTTGSGGEKDG